MAKIKDILAYINFLFTYGRKLKNPKKAQDVLFRAWYEWIETGDDTLLLMIEIHVVFWYYGQYSLYDVRN